MASDQSAVAFEGLDEVAGDDRRLVGAPACDLAELAAALAQVEALLTAGADDGPDAAAALERIADIAFVLHEREVEPSLCDALDAAMREIGEANARHRASVQRANDAAGLLRALAHRLDAMIAAQAQEQASRSASGAELECADEFPAPARLFDTEMAEDGTFAQTVAALAESLPGRSDAAPAQFLDQVADGSAAFEALTHSQGDAVQAETSPSPGLQAEKLMRAGEESGRRDDVAATSVTESLSRPEAVATVALPTGASAAPTVEAIDPDEDPGDLFEPMPGIRTAADAAVPLPTPTVNGPAATASGVSAHAASRPAANDPLAPIRALSEEELIALFS